ncbi:hypothetical protein LINGRAHAP2_LOCUS20816 [Linum grandiflorum]
MNVFTMKLRMSSVWQPGRGVELDDFVLWGTWTDSACELHFHLLGEQITRKWTEELRTVSRLEGREMVKTKTKRMTMMGKKIRNTIAFVVSMQQLHTPIEIDETTSFHDTISVTRII